MGFQVQVKTTATMKGAYPYDFSTKEDRDDFLQQYDDLIFWFFLPEEDESFFSDSDGPSWANPRGSGWRKGGAFKAQEATAEEPADEIAPAEVPDDGERW